MKALIFVLGVVLLVLTGLFLEQRQQLEELSARLTAVETGTVQNAPQGAGPVPRAASTLASGAVRAPARARVSSPRSGPAQADVTEVLAQPGARSQIAEIVREEQEEAEQQRWESRRQMRLDMLRDEADAWAADEGIEPEVAEQFTVLLEGWIDQRFGLREAVMSGEMAPMEARQEGMAMREELRLEAAELVGEEAMPALEDRFQMLREGGGRPPGPPRF